jgi:hypothetical protein
VDSVTFPTDNLTLRFGAVWKQALTTTREQAGMPDGWQAGQQFWVELVGLGSISSYVPPQLRIWIACEFCGEGLMFGSLTVPATEKCIYSVRNARVGSVDAARCAGMNAAIIAHIARISTATARTRGLPAFIPYS